MIFGSLFSGIGGFDLGFERAGMTCAWQVEIDAKCQDILNRHWPDVPKYEDVRNVGRNLEPVDLICGGFPCQDLSVAGQRKGLAGERSGLWFEFHRVLKELRPGWVVIENVPGLLSSDGGRDFAIILQGLVELGYGVCWRVLDAQYFGVAQRRRRVFIVGHLGDGRAAQVLFEREGSAWDSAPSREATASVAGSLAPGAHPGGLTQYEVESGLAVVASLRNRGNGSGTRQDNETGLVAYKKRGGFGVSETGDIAGTLESEGGTHQGGPERTPMIVFQPRYYTRDNKPGGQPSDTADITNCHKAGDSVPHVVAIRNSGRDADMRPGRNGTTTQGDVMYSLQAEQQHAVFLHCNKGRPNGRQSKHTPMVTVEDIPTTLNTDGHAQSPIAGPWGVRRLTPTECERLQGFPDGWTDGQSDSARYRQLGNAVCVNNAEWLGERIVRLF